MYQHNCWQKLRAEVNKVSVSLITRDIAKHGDQNCQAFERSPLWLSFPFDSHPGLTWFYVLLIEPTGQSSNSY